MDQPPTLSLARVLVTILVILSAVAVITMLMVPLTSRWFWPAAGGFVIAGGLALAIPLRSPEQ